MQILSEVPTIPETGDVKSMGIDAIRGKRVYIESYGCTYNSGDAEKLARVLGNQGCTRVESASLADVVIINTCTVIAPTERHMLRILGEYRDRELYVSGCMPVVQLEKIQAVCSPGVIFPKEIYRKYRRLQSTGSATSGIVQIAQGCLGSCTYCITRKARGPLVSFSLDEIVSQVEACASTGIPEIQLTAQDVSAWGRDIGKTLPDLLKRISRKEGNFSLRLGMMNPKTLLPILPAMLDAFSHENIFRFVHLPVQSGSNRVLEQMGRGYSRENFIAITDTLRSRFPDLNLMTDVIVGYPGETEREFGETLDLLERTWPQKVNVTRFSKREHTPVATVQEFPDFVKKDRSRIVLAIAERIYHRSNAEWIGKTVPFIVTEKRKPGSVLCRTGNYLNIVLREDLPLGYRGRARIREDKTYYFTGEFLEEIQGFPEKLRRDTDDTVPVVHVSSPKNEM
ncbi:MAG: tRNA (N(6)-L-threonylcarbamoyladenosine(37)-C(2))-methylthiotransferase [Methanoregulaceae archaeon]